MEKVISILKKYKLWIILGINLVCALGVSVYAYYKSTVVFLPQETKKNSTDVLKEEKTEETTNKKTDFSAKRAKREKEYFMNAQTYPGGVLSSQSDKPADDSKITIDTPNQPSVQNEVKPEVQEENIKPEEQKKPEQPQQEENGAQPNTNAPQPEQSQQDTNTPKPDANTQPSEPKPQENPAPENPNPTNTNP